MTDAATVILPRPGPRAAPTRSTPATGSAGTTHAGYRPDIDGLRALAVLAVVVFHAFPRLVRGGFVGVDVFFVISGFLITGILVRAVDADSFSVLEFYARRARRIFPALVLVLAATIAAGALVLPAHENERLGQHVVAGALFSSNLLLWREAGYFDVASAGKPLLHLWSLGIEEQFYLAWPVLIVLLSRVRRLRFGATAVIALASFALSVRLASTDASAGFYSPATRAWELMAGAMLGMTGRTPTVRLSPAWRDVLSIAGAGLIATSIAWFDAATPFPGWHALLPVIGAVFLVGAGPAAWFNRRVLSRPVAVSIGLVSYPLYLWHWPVLVLVRRFVSPGTTPAALSVPVTVLAVLLSAVLAYGTWRLVEIPVRRRALVPVALRCAFALGATALLGTVVSASRADFDHDALVAEAARNDWATPKSQLDVYYASEARGAPEVVFVGDSHMEQYFPAVRHALAAWPAMPVAFSTHGGCPFLPTFRPALCGPTYQRSMRLAASAGVRRVVIASAWDVYYVSRTRTEAFYLRRGQMPAAMDALKADVQRLRALGKEVVIIGGHPHADVADPELLAAHTRVGLFGTRAPTRFAQSFPLADFQRATATETALLSRLADETGAVFIDPAAAMCPAGRCFTTDGAGTPVRKDDNHLRPFAAIRYLTYVPSLVAPPAGH